MKNIVLLMLLIGGFWSCKDQCTETRMVIRDVPVAHPFSEIRNSVKSLPARDIKDPGKVIINGKYLFVTEIKEGIHLIDNSDPANPIPVSFIQIPGNGDFTVNGNILYADSYCDLISLDITDPGNVKEIGRSNELYKFGWFNGIWWSVEYGGLFFNEYKKDTITETVSVDCENNTVEPEPYVYIDRASPEALTHAKTPPRFSIQDKYMYSSSIDLLEIFNLDNPVNLKPVSSIVLNQANFAFSSYQNKLFIGKAYDLAIYDSSNPLEPKFVSRFDSVTACDKIAIQNNIAYIARRNGLICGGENELRLFDISNISAPRFIKKYAMDGPRALSVDFPILFICEGVKGFKVFDVSDTATIDQHLLSYEKDIQANDVFISGKKVIITATDGIYQLDATDPRNLRLLSKIPFKKS
ncbi:LVIVD repeat-containing protein [Dyadobacter sp. CY356]|uniref:LVIVD repeat-containing protein n=1 Tax=Dyadobacter sp. CY356 TaxID=2906442 RepID=UPI001F1A71DB|nr:hypothetical protein [Dyadobacter sp. CY356]MCF0059507.1 hypothetical protein [Dyadobacter sp. CY356]